MTPTPTTPAEWRAEQERVLRLSNAYEEADAAFEAADTEYWRNYRGQPHPMALTTLGSKRNQARRVLELRAPALARAYAAACGQMAEMVEFLRDCDTELDDLMCRVRRLAEDAPDDDTTDADELRRRIAALLPAPPQAQASADAGGEG